MSTSGRGSFRNHLIIRFVLLTAIFVGLGLIFYVGYGGASSKTALEAQSAVAPASASSSAPETAIETITTFTKTIGGNWWSWAASIAAVSTLSMALVEFFKAIFDIRRWYQEARLRSWIESGKGDRAKEAFEELIFLAIGDWGSLPALCSQPIEKMMGEIQPAANIALDSPEQYPSLYAFLTQTDLPMGGTSPRRQLERAALSVPDPDRSAIDRELHRRRVSAGAAVPPGAPADADARDDTKARLRLANLMSRKLDAFQLRTQYYWDRGNQTAAVIISLAIVFIALSQGGPLTAQTFILGLVSGIVSPFVKDLASGLSQFATKS